eukprot:3691732-Amphidinium_carterae.1
MFRCSTATVRVGVLVVLSGKDTARQRRLSVSTLAEVWSALNAYITAVRSTVVPDVRTVRTKII